MKMKIFIALAFIVGVFAAPQDSQMDQQTSLMLEFKDFITAMPMQKMYNTLVDHLQNDAEMQAALKHVQGQEFSKAHSALLAKPSAKEIMMRCKDAGLDTERYITMADSIISGLFISVPADTEKSFGDFLDDIDHLIPYDTLLGILADKLENSPVFIKFFEAVSSNEMRGLSEKMMRSSEFKHVAQELEDMDLPVYQIADAVFSVFGWKNKQLSANDL